jgi:hypothetical protein
MRFCFHSLRLAALACVVSAAAPVAAWAQTVSFVFVAPTATMTTNFGAAAIIGPYADGYRGARITAANLATFRKVAPKHLQLTYDALQPGAVLRTKVDRVMKISKGNVTDVEFQLVDDHAGLTGRYSYAHKKATDNRFYVWPAAGSDPATPPAKGWTGSVGVGEYWAANLTATASYGWTGWESVLLHETLHTQMVGQHTKWGSIAITYGLDEMHRFSEILGAQDLAFEEGLGTFFGYAHWDPQGYNRTNAFFSDATERYMMEDGSIPASWDLRKLPKKTEPVKDIPEDVKKNQPTRTEWNRYYFFWKDVPGQDILFNEWTSTGLLVYFWKHANNDPAQALKMVEEMSVPMSGNLRNRYPTFAANNLGAQMEAFAATAEGQRKKAAGTLTSSMFPIAVLDMIMHFGMTDAEFQTEFRRNQHVVTSKALTEYWKHRDAIRKICDPHFKANPIRFTVAVGEVHAYFQKAATILTNP